MPGECASYNKDDTKCLLDLRKVTARFIIPPDIPLWVTFDVDIFGHYSINTDATMQADWGFKSTHTLKVGGEFIDFPDVNWTRAYTASFTPITEYTPVNEIYPLNINGEVNLNARLELYPHTEVKFYDIFGPYADVVPYVKGNYNGAMHTEITSAGQQTFLAWNSGIDIGLDLRVGTKLTFIGSERTFGPEEINCFSKPLYSSPVKVSLVEELPAYVPPDSIVNVKIKVTDTLGLPAFYCPVYISGNGNFNDAEDELLITDSNGEASFTWELLNSGESSFMAKLYNADHSVRDSFIFTVNIEGLTDYDGNTYRVVKIGNQWWMAENIKAITYRSASGYSACSLPQDIGGPQYYNYPDTILLRDKLGYLYNFEAAKVICPEGWRLPSKDDWQELISYVANDGHPNVASALKAVSGWDGYDGGNGTDDYGFSAYRTGTHTNIDSTFSYGGATAAYWSGTYGTWNDGYPGVYILLIINDVEIILTGYKFQPVRCVKN